MNAVFNKGLSSMLDEVDGEVVRDVEVDLIDPDPEQPRKDFKQESIEEMGESLAAEGQIQPIEVIELLTGRFQLIVGERRWRGAKWKGLPTLKAFVRMPGTSAKAIRRRQLIENVQREDMSAKDMANAIRRLVEDEGSAAAAARALKKSEGQISKYLSILNLPPIAAELAGGKITRDVETLTTVAAIERQDPAAAQELVEEAIETGSLSRGRVREVAQEVNSRLKGKKNGGAVQPAAALAPAPAGRPSSSDAVSPVRVKDTEALAISVKVVESHRDAKRFNKAKEEHGDPQLYQRGVSRNPDRCWILFGDSSRAKRTDSTPRLQEFPCSAIVLGMVTKYALAND